MSTHEPGADLDPGMTGFDLVREGARRDGVEIVHYAPKFPIPGTRRERRVERAIAGFFTLAALAGIGFWRWRSRGSRYAWSPSKFARRT